MQTASERSTRRRWWRWPVRLLLIWLVLALAAPPLHWLELRAIHAYRSHKDFRAKYTHCQYRPSCSRYGLAVLERDGFWRGNARLGLRLLTCSPLGYVLGEPNQGKAGPFDAWAPPPTSVPTDKREVSTQQSTTVAKSAEPSSH